MARLLLSGFGPFGEHSVNASAEVARRIWEEGLEGCDLVKIELPTVRGESADMLVHAFDRVSPDFVVMLGIAGDRDEITPERVAINVDDYRIPDNAGNQPVDEPVIAGAPAAYLSTLPVKRIVAALSASGLPSRVSNSAGTYLCNHVSYAMLHHIERSGAPCRAGFIHIPQMSEAVPEGSPSMPFSTLVVGVTIAIQAILGQLPA
ncbi:MAG TPA: pyroglutamyl-peptidase I [Blastocatellia bacterium]|nr:pyroglutamyl-peptidase I [Blastocatellia bacterium]